jgi:hypothetical protein
MDAMKYYLPAGLAIIAIILCGTVHGFVTGRWEMSPTAQAAGARLANVALDLGDWNGEDLPLRAGGSEPMAGELYRRYVNRATGKAVRVFLVCGRPGPVSVHTPDSCYAASGYKVKVLGKLSARSGGDATAEFEAADLLKQRAMERDHLRILWSWNAAGSWVVPQDTRLTFARFPYLYKLYLMRDLSRSGEPLDGDPCTDLMRQLGPELQRALFSGT